MSRAFFGLDDSHSLDTLLTTWIAAKYVGPRKMSEKERGRTSLLPDALSKDGHILGLRLEIAERVKDDCRIH